MSEITYTGTGKKPGLNWVHEETTTGVSAEQVIADQVNKLKMVDDLRAELAAAQAEGERLRGIIREAIGYCSGSRVAHIGEFKAYVPQIDVEAVKRWRETVEGGAQ